MSEALLTSILNQALSLGLAAFFWQYVQKKLEKVDELEKRILKMETREEVKKELGK